MKVKHKAQKANIKKTTALLCLLLSSAVFARPGLLERRNQEKIRASGFTDVELDRLHAEIGQAIKDLSSLAVPEDSLPSDPTAKPTDPSQGQVESTDLQQDSIEIQPSLQRAFVKGMDSSGRTYYRLRISEGLNYTTEPTPDRFLFKAHAFFYLDDQGRLSEVLLQFYRMRFSGMAYTREIRRIRHPGPFGAGTAQSPMQIEFRSYPGSIPHNDLAEDDVPRPVLSGQPQLLTVLHNADDPIPFDKQARIIETYRSLLRKLNRQLARQKQVLMLDRNSAIERAIDFTGTSF